MESPLVSTLDPYNELLSVELPESPPTLAVFMDVNVVPEHEKKELEQTTLNLEGEIEGLRSKLRFLDQKRRKTLNKILDLKGSIRVFCRVRPFLSTDKRRIREFISTNSEKVSIRLAGSKKEFGFDKVFLQEASQEDVFMEVEPILRSALDGHNVCILAYGQTGTGKTFTMEGTNNNPGIVLRALEELFHQASMDSSVSFTFSMSMLEVYMGNLRDLLSPKPSSRAFEAVSKCGFCSSLNIQTDLKGFVEIEKLTDVGISDFTQARRWYVKGKRARSTSWTNVNEASSRSHCLTRITIGLSGSMEEGKVHVGKFWMVDLGGSERLLKTGATGHTLDEGKAINLSLSALGDVIAALRRKRSHVPYRNSKLTQVLKDSLGDDSKALMLVHISPCEEDVGETICSLNFAMRARAIESSRELPEELKAQREHKISNLDQEMRDTEVEYQKITNQIQKAEFLLQENKKLFSIMYGLLKDQTEDTPKNPVKDHKEAIETPRAAIKTNQRVSSKSLPRFMTSTEASRQRQNVATEEIHKRVRILRSGTKNSMQISGSLSLSHSDHLLKAIIQNSNKKCPKSKPDSLLTESPRFNGSDLRTCPTARNKRVTTSYPNLKGNLDHHRRRMSDLI